MELIKRKQLRDKKKAEEEKKEIEREAAFRKPVHAYTPTTRKMTIIVFIVIVSVIFYTYFTSESVLQNDCSLMPGVECRNLAVSAGAVSFEAHNFLKEDLNITLQLESCEGKETHVIRPNEKAVYSFNCTIKDRVVRKKIFMTYVGFSGLPHDEIGYLAAKG